MTKAETKVLAIYEMLKRLVSGYEIYAQDVVLRDELGIDERSFRRYIEDIKDLFKDAFIYDTKRMPYTQRAVKTL
ncbi:hypothetical protein CCAL13119_07080 [Campylobacter sp. RM13119]|uniref:hypothetical protein n=1 Tax=Campylobacter californiensis TaxID=1032243 RepID=UPI00147508D5|nr:hypothetical protein [Campylobacter sp. RM13119]MBE3606705.1 hypothetical protein [Campylobacter sp. RM13119]